MHRLQASLSRVLPARLLLLRVHMLDRLPAPAHRTATVSSSRMRRPLLVQVPFDLQAKRRPVLLASQVRRACRNVRRPPAAVPARPLAARRPERATHRR